MTHRSMRLVTPDDLKKARLNAPTPPSGYRQQQAFKKLDRLLFRVIQLDQILDHHCGCGLEEECACNSEKALDLKHKIWRAQKKLDQLFVEIDREDAVLSS